ncbi:site-2 protease family protein [Candidatus Woesearchaeota archaeon]|nr:site-2 protease family protein [Candidatus Woesearchaeota archaeon]
MAILSFMEIIDFIIMTLFLGYLFQDMFARSPHAQRFDWKSFRFAVYVTAPAIILHELFHKLAALAFGFDAVFHAFYADTTTLWLGIFALLAKLAHFGFFFIVPGFVSISGSGTPLHYALIAFAGPALNLLLWQAASYLSKRHTRHGALLAVTAKINMFLFIFNMLPIPGFDGFQVYLNLWRAIF